MDELDGPSILAVGARLANLRRSRLVGSDSATIQKFDSLGSSSDCGSRVQLVEVETGKQAFDLLKVLKFDLIAIGTGVNGTGISDMGPQQFVQRLQTGRLWQKWALVADQDLTAEDESIARSMGAVAVLDGPDAWDEMVSVARQVRRRNPTTTIPNLSLRSVSL